MTTSTWDKSPSVRPVIADMQNGGAFANDPTYPPPTDSTNPGTGKFLTANMLNQAGDQLAAFARVSFSLVLDVDHKDFGAGTVPYIKRVASPAAFVDTFVGRDAGASDDSPFTVTEPLLGQVQITWTSGDLPTDLLSTVHAMVGLTGSTAGTVTFAGALAAGFTIYTYDTTGTLARLPFTVAIF